MKHLVYLLTLAMFGPCQQAVPPITKQLVNEESYPFQYDPIKLTATVPETISYKQSNNGTDCNGGSTPKQQAWAIINHTDYVEVTIFLSDGVKPGIDNERSFGLYNAVSGSEIPTVGPLTLVMRSGDTNPYLLSKVTWRFAVDSVDSPLTEVVNSGESNTSDFPKHINLNTPLGKYWYITVPAGVKPENVHASIIYYLHMGNVMVCL